MQQRFSQFFMYWVILKCILSIMFISLQNPGSCFHPLKNVNVFILAAFRTFSHSWSPTMSWKSSKSLILTACLSEDNKVPLFNCSHLREASGWCLGQDRHRQETSGPSEPSTWILVTFLWSDLHAGSTQDKQKVNRLSFLNDGRRPLLEMQLTSGKITKRSLSLYQLFNLPINRLFTNLSYFNVTFTKSHPLPIIALQRGRPSCVFQNEEVPTQQGGWIVSPSGGLWWVSRSLVPGVVVSKGSPHPETSRKSPVLRYCQSSHPDPRAKSKQHQAAFNLQTERGCSSHSESVQRTGWATRTEVTCGVDFSRDK